MDNDKIKNLLETLSQEQADIVQVILHHTIYISHEYMLKLLNNALDDFEMLCPEYSLYIPDGKIGSEHYLLTLLHDRLKPKKVCYGKHIFDKDLPILLIDDAIYSSINMCCIVDNFREIGINNEVYCVVAVTSSLTPQVVTDFGATIIAGLNLEHLRVNNLIPNYDDDNMYELFGCESEYILPIFFDHKIANEFGSYQFYHKIVKTPINRTPIDLITESQIRKIVNQL
uniref:Phosphoribosyl transferase domain protein n=1 Tax=Pithovirus LCPAC401 TaxID=2506595 RepID=A0A481ZCJ4_9VIRU|nr:MAG: uncharacterized protein LCPAC401_00190 [Pithovirus LCPAC401]